jgi:SAM-dependent methyltransferase
MVIKMFILKFNNGGIVVKKNIILFLTVSISFCYSMEQSQTTYLGLCTEFWDFDKPYPPASEYAFFRYYVAQSKGPILEPMCGSGRYIIPLLEEGFEVEGFDASPFMFNALRKKCEEKNLSPRIWEQYLELMPETKQYDLIFIPDTSFCHFLNSFTIKKVLQKIYSLLLSGGTFVFNLQTTSMKLDNVGVWTGKIYRKPNATIIIENRLILPIENSIVPLILKYELINNTEILRTEMEYYQIKLFHATEMDALLKDIGFSEVKKIKAYQHGKAPSYRDEVIVYECIK